MSFVEGLRCRECSRAYPAEALHVCEYCFGPLEIAYDYAAIAKVLTRAVIEARVLVTDRMIPLTVAGRRLHQVGLPYHGGSSGLSTGDSANDLAALSLDPNVHIQEVKAFACDIRPGRRPRGPARLDLVREYQRRAGITEQTGMEA